MPISAIWLGERLTPFMIAGGVTVLVSTLQITVWEERLRSVSAAAGDAAARAARERSSPSSD